MSNQLCVAAGKKGGRHYGNDNIKKKFTVVLTVSQYIALNDLAVFEGQTMTSIIRRAIVDELRRVAGRKYT